MEYSQKSYQEEKVRRFVEAMWDLQNSVPDDEAETVVAMAIYENTPHAALIAQEIQLTIEDELRKAEQNNF